MFSFFKVLYTVCRNTPIPPLNFLYTCNFVFNLEKKKKNHYFQQKKAALSYLTHIFDILQQNKEHNFWSLYAPSITQLFILENCENTNSGTALQTVATCLSKSQ